MKQRQTKQRISAERVREVLEMAFEGQLYDYRIDERWGCVDVRYCDGAPIKDMRRVLLRNLKGWHVHAERVYSAEAVADELYRLCTAEGWRLRRDGDAAHDTPEDAQRVAVLLRDSALMFAP